MLWPQRGQHNALWELILYFPEVLLDRKDNSCGHTSPRRQGLTFMEIFVMGDGAKPSASIWTFSPLSCNINSYNRRGSMVVGLQHRADENVKDLLKMCVRGWKRGNYIWAMLIYHVGWGTQIKRPWNVSHVKTEICSCHFPGCCVAPFRPFHTHTFKVAAFVCCQTC